MKLIKFIVVVIICSISAGACEKSFLKVNDNSFLNRQSYVKDLKSLQEFLNGIYVLLNSALVENRVNSVYPEIVADNLKPLASGKQALISHYTWSQKADESNAYGISETDLNMNSCWMSSYQIIRACNFVVETTGQYRKENPALADKLKGEALVIRALLHFKLTNVFAQSFEYSSDASHIGIPYITTSDISVSFTRSTVAEVYDNLIKDIKDAIELLPVDYFDARKMNLPTANALLARVYLFKGDYIKAKEYAISVTSQVPLMTITEGYPNAIFKKASTIKEVLFQLTPVNNTEASKFIGMYLQGANKLYLPTMDIIEILTEDGGDIRSSWVKKNSGNWDVIKYPVGVAVETPSISIPETAYYVPIIRSSEMFLTAAEALAKVGDESLACNYLNAIRRRANPSKLILNISGKALLDSIYKERRKELCFEGYRMFDLQRWKLGVHRNDVHSSYSTAKDLSFPNDKAISPIPMKDMILANIIQNDSY